MGRWAVVAQWGAGETYNTEIVTRVTGSREDARAALTEATRVVRKPMREKHRSVYRFPGGDSYLVVVQGALSRTETTVSIAELVYDSADPSIARAAAEADGSERPEETGGDEAAGSGAGSSG
ncbi:hypothetical protein [Streptomyces omiyaensis]|uniref:Uncharacterized protein n=1 Tax=Streptomyces omiyaensis TaxID=68247 RepID=A0ABW7BYN6_9ACTN|nr:hypothetical protein [Streptomyces omiyaensis]GGY68275.1 hypothetical protein GCM10010363_56980 [Streptomyces omiyaensis]